MDVIAASCIGIAAPSAVGPLPVTELPYVADRDVLKAVK
jgi:hypothetical protein